MKGRDGIMDGLGWWWNGHFQYNALIESKLVEHDMTRVGTNGKQSLRNHGESRCMSMLRFIPWRLQRQVLSW